MAHSDKEAELIHVHTRLPRWAVAELKKIAAERGIPWQVELRSLIHRTLKGEKREVVVLKE